MTQYLTSKQVAERLQLAQSTILIYCRDGVFPGAFQAKKHGAWRIPESDLEQHGRPATRAMADPEVLLPPRNARSAAQVRRSRKAW